MKRTVWKCDACGSPCSLMSIDADSDPEKCPYYDFMPTNWKKVSECEVPEDATDTNVGGKEDKE